jgi:hypothetical protein
MIPKIKTLNKGKMYHVMTYIREGLKNIKHKLWRKDVKESGVLYI